MPYNWQEIPLVELCDEITVGHVGAMANEYAQEGIPFFRSKNIGENAILWDDVKFVSRSFHLRLKKSSLGPGDVVVVRTGNPGTSCVIPENISEANCSDLVVIRPDTEKISPYYLSYFINSAARHHVNSYLVGAVQQHFNVGAARKIVVKLPSRDVQNEIVSIIKSIDDKRHLNSKINQTLEQITQALFKSWFIDFEPVKAKMAALESGSTAGDAERAAIQAISGKDQAELDTLRAQNPDQYDNLARTAALFPSTMVESELGKIPEGWDVEPLDSVAHYQNGLALQRYRPEDENDYLPVVKIAQLRQGYADGGEKASPNIKRDCIIDDGDVVFSWSGSLMVDVWCGGKAALNQHLFKVTSNRFPRWFYFHFTRHHLEQFKSIAESKAVTMGHIKREHLRQALCVVPPLEIIEAGSSLLGSILERQVGNRLESQSLKDLRDTLLPKLLSGQLTIPETEENKPETADV